MYFDRPHPSSFLFLSVCSILVLISTLSAPCYAANVTVDDQFGDELSGALPEYSVNWSQGEGCSSCALHPNPANAFRNSWHDTTFFAGGSESTISVNFTGVAVYAFFIVPDTVQGDVTVDTDLIFTLDGEQAGNYSHSPTGGADFLFNELCFVNENLANGSHELVMSATAPDGGSTAALFDYLIYTTANNSSSSNSSTGASLSKSPIHTSRTGAVVGGIIGGISVVVLVLVLFLFYRRRSRLRRVTQIDLQSPTSESSSKVSRWNFFRPREAPSEFEVHPAMFDAPTPTDVSSTPRRHHDTEKELSSGPQNGASETTRMTDDQSTFEPGSRNTSDILSQVAALQATVLSLQEQRLNYHHGSLSEVGDPPAYSPDL